MTPGFLLGQCQTGASRLSQSHLSSPGPVFVLPCFSSRRPGLGGCQGGGGRSRANVSQSLVPPRACSCLLPLRLCNHSVGNEVRMLRGVGRASLPWNALGENLVSCLFQLLVAAGIPRLVATLPQPLPSHGLLLSLTCLTNPPPPGLSLARTL